MNNFVVRESKRKIVYGVAVGRYVSLLGCICAVGGGGVGSWVSLD